MFEWGSNKVFFFLFCLIFFYNPKTPQIWTTDNNNIFYLTCIIYNRILLTVSGIYELSRVCFNFSCGKRVFEAPIGMRHTAVEFKRYLSSLGILMKILMVFYSYILRTHSIQGLNWTPLPSFRVVWALRRNSPKISCFSTLILYSSSILLW